MLALSHPGFTGRAPMTTGDAPTDAAVRVRDLTKRFGRTWALRGITFELPAASCLLVVGPNGAGKSTLVGVLSTLLAPTAGSVHIFGQSAAGEAEAVRRSVGVLTHQPMLYPHLTVVENLRLFASLFGVEDLEECLAAALETFELAERADEPVASLSHGISQRAALARALLHRPGLLLLDEPFAGLDDRGRPMLRDLLKGLHEQGVTILLTAHDLEPVVGLPDTVAVLGEGELRGLQQRSAWTETDIREFYHQRLASARRTGESA